MDYIVLLYQEYAQWYMIAFYLLILKYAVLCIGWYFSTDYYEKYIDNLMIRDDYNKPEEGYMHILYVICIGSIILVFANFDINSPERMFTLTILWFAVIMPGLIKFVITSRSAIRTKRGK